ncbi:NAD-dependent malic enzyme [Crassaminicella thermophila]|uniref:NAD-dependent malic enzyme n=1 Tax=Crassaminicella thermophila TaxID=2599308 RepID=A0A5C0S8V5_CRATE|nr:malic enzyme-like NAD(P)-binding protein [Crassaminicella thermophila]QEK11095.1 NAD-dependent malic enzyme [Crassaminicella thermophila]
MPDYNELALTLHKENKGKISVESKVALENKDDLSTAYTPGVAEPCRVINKNREAVYDYTAKGNMVAVVSDGTAVLGLGDIGAYAAIPVMEGKAVLFKSFANVDAFPICLNTKDTEEIIKTIKLMEPMFGGINLEDIAAPRCFEIEERLKKELDIPVFHDDQHGTAIVVLAGLINALKLANKKIEDIEVVINGPGSAGIAIAKILLRVGVKDIVLCNKEGAIYDGAKGLNWAQEEIAKVTNKKKQKGSLGEIMKNKDVFIGVSAPNIVTKEMVASMKEKAIVFAMANPVPEIMPEEAKEAGAFIVGTGRSDYPNQINNVLAFPGVFRGALDVRARQITEDMKISAAYAIANALKEDTLSVDNIIPNPLDKEVAKAVAQAVMKTARENGVARI